MSLPDPCPTRPLSKRALASVRRGGAGGLSALAVIVAVDSLVRAQWARDGAIRHFAQSLVVLGGIAAAAGAILILLATAARSLTGGRRRLADVVVATSCGALVALSAKSAVFTGRRLHGTAAPLVVAALFGLATAGAALLWMREERRHASRPSTHLRRSLAVALAIVLGDAKMLLGVHASLHFAVEVGVFLLLLATSVTWLARIDEGGHRRARHAIAGTSAIAVGWGLLFAVSGAVRTPTVFALRHVLNEPSVVGVLYGRVVRWTAPALPKPKPIEVATTDDYDRWATGETEPPDEAREMASIRGPCINCSIVVFFVDTLRADTASDPEKMPNLTSFGARALRFDNAYSTASDTLGALPSLVSGRYGQNPEAAVLQRIRASNIDNALFIPSSAHDYLAAHYPGFRFDDVDVVPDGPQGDDSFVYGADTPTSEALAEHAIDWIRKRRGKRFFSWIYSFDLHAWKELRADRLRESWKARRAERSRPEARYWNVARLVDKAFGRVMRGLEDLGLADRTVVMFVSDHGEALGYHGFWRHSSYLWQPLVRVPLAVRVPGMDPRAIDRPISLVDVGPTLARFVDPSAEVGGYHGIDLLRLCVRPETQRTLPILLRATADGRTNLVGVVTDTRKLVVPAGGGPPQLHDLSRADPDETDLVVAEPEHAASLLHDIETSPVYFE